MCEFAGHHSEPTPTGGELSFGYSLPLHGRIHYQFLGYVGNDS